MELTIRPDGVLQIDDARITYRNFSGEGSPFNKEGDRNFALIIPTQEMADMLIEEGWNVKIKAPRDGYEDPFMYLGIKVKFNSFGPNVYLKSGNSVNKLDEESVRTLDRARLMNINMDIRPYDYEIPGRKGRSAYLQSFEAEQRIEDRFAAKYDEY